MARIDNLTVTIKLANDAGITVDMVEALGRCVRHACSAFVLDEMERDLSREAIRRLVIVTTGHPPAEDDEA